MAPFGGSRDHPPDGGNGGDWDPDSHHGWPSLAAVLFVVMLVLLTMLVA